jgi:hypothetical protein
MSIVLGAVALSALVSTASAAGGWDPEYYANPWTGVCVTGTMQTPIDLKADYRQLPAVPDELVTDIKMPMVKNAVVKNVASAMQVFILLFRAVVTRCTCTVPPRLAGCTCLELLLDTAMCTLVLLCVRSAVASNPQKTASLEDFLIS